MSKPQVPYIPGEIYHVFNHANGWELVFREEENFRYFLQKYGEAMPPLLETLAYCLLPNHFHSLVRVRPKETLAVFYRQKHGLPPLSPGDAKGLAGPDFNKIVRQEFGNFLGGYARAFNNWHERMGSLFMQNTKRKLVGTPQYFKNVIHYIHCNAMHHDFVAYPEAWPHSSYHAFLSDKPTKLAREQGLQWFGGVEAFVQFHQKPPLPGMEELLEV
ncbi:MAG: hypothetical protein EPO28_15395 [Saprospiraceae bacterium]|nr:MAG: hypothetical protein EPO28_15395 [Saprospiraceae bacterium]